MAIQIRPCKVAVVVLDPHYATANLIPRAGVDLANQIHREPVSRLEIGANQGGEGGGVDDGRRSSALRSDTLRYTYHRTIVNAPHENTRNFLRAPDCKPPP